jgi:hypothetical protein
MDLSILEKALGWLFKPAIFFFRYLKHRPDIRVSLQPIAIKHRGEGGPMYHFLWEKFFVIHNDSPHLARGVKLLSPFPSGWTMHADFPTRLEPDQRVKIPLTIEWQEQQTSLVSRFGTSSQYNMSDRLESEILSRFGIKIAFDNEYGHRFHQLFRWSQGSIRSEFLKKPD